MADRSVIIISMSRIDGRAAACAFAVVFLAFFLHLPLGGALPGNTDTILAIALSNHILEKVVHFFTGGSPFTAMYPARDVLAYGENCYGLASVFLAFKLLTRSDLWGYYLTISTLFTLNALAMFRWARLYVDDSRVAWLAGLVFSLSALLLGNIDDPNLVFLLFPLLSLHSLELWVREGRTRALRAALLLAGAQIWFGFYLFVFHALVLILAIIHYRKLLAQRLRPWDLVSLAGAYLLACAPLLAVYLHHHFHANLFSPYDSLLTARQTSMGWHNFWNAVPGNLLYGESWNSYADFESSGWGRIRKSAFPGFVLPALALAGAGSSRARRGFPALVVLVFLTLSLGVHLPGFEALMRIPAGAYFRVPVRFLLFALMPLVLYGAIGLSKVQRALPGKRGIGAAAAAAALVILENAPFPLQGFPARDLLAPPASYVEFFRGRSEPAIVVDLPSSCFYRDGDRPDEGGLWFYNRDILYMNWQPIHRQIIAGGVNSYVSRARAELDPELQRVPEREALRKLRSVGVEYVVFHKKLVLLPDEDILARLRSSSDLVQRLDDERIAIFEIRL